MRGVFYLLQRNIRQVGEEVAAESLWVKAVAPQPGLQSDTTEITVIALEPAATWKLRSPIARTRRRSSG